MNSFIFVLGLYLLAGLSYLSFGSAEQSFWKAAPIFLLWAFNAQRFITKRTLLYFSLIAYLLIAITFSLPLCICTSFYRYIAIALLGGLMLFQNRKHFLSWALWASWWGDVLLAENQFIPGLSAFLVAHLFYISGFIKKFRFRPQTALAGVALSALGIAIYALLFPKLDIALKIALAVYIIVLVSMGTLAFFYYPFSWWLATGALCFVVSDAIIGINKFYAPIENAHLWIMTLYYSAQLLISYAIFKNE